MILLKSVKLDEYVCARSWCTGKIWALSFEGVENDFAFLGENVVCARRVLEEVWPKRELELSPLVPPVIIFPPSLQC